MRTGWRPCRLLPVNGRPSLPGCDQVRPAGAVSPVIYGGAADALRQQSCGQVLTFTCRDTPLPAAPAAVLSH